MKLKILKIMKHLKRFNENSDEEDYNKYLEHKKSMTKTLTEEEFNNVTDDDLSRVIVASNDGQGDTSLESFIDIASYHEEDVSNIQILEYMFEPGANYVKIGWIENNKFLKLIVK